MAMRISVPEEDAEPEGAASLSCPRCGKQVGCRLGEGTGWIWEKHVPGEPVEGLVTDPRDLPAAVLDHCRPCPFVSCRAHLCLDPSGPHSLSFTHPEVPVWQMVESCSLDVVDDNPDGVELEDLLDLLGRSYDRSFQITDEALARAREMAEAMGEDGFPWEGMRNRGRPSTLAALATPARRHTIRDVRGRISGIPLPEFPPLPFRRPSPEEIAILKPGAAISPDYGKPRPPADPEGTQGEGEITRSRWALRVALAREARRLRAQNDPGPVQSDDGCADGAIDERERIYLNK